MPSFTSETSDQVPYLQAGAVHVWTLKLSNEMTSLDCTTLSAEEQEKGNRLRNPKHRSRAISMRIQLRQLLSVYLNVKPVDVLFQYAEFGKPSIVNSPLSFNVSHCGDLALVAVSLTEDLGVDVEQWRTLDNIEGLVQRNFSAEEKNEWLGISKENKNRVFFNIWTCKEAFIKATGRGLGMGVNRMTFSLAYPHEMADCPEEYGRADEWCCVPLAFDGLLSATLVVRASICKPLIFEFDSDNLPRMR